ncbi:MAG: hypothetical protein OSA43_03390, partial [Pirellulales bacterium]|nr:hypothetical protein [Pirellulales bacterium]
LLRHPRRPRPADREPLRLTSGQALGQPRTGKEKCVATTAVGVNRLEAELPPAVSSSGVGKMEPPRIQLFF